jgi:predicted nucleotidyltransferase component of viral defense system
MIKPSEIQKLAHRIGVRDTQIEKDYVLSWILWGIANHEHLSQSLVFKGGTVLKKVYFPDYRYSEDLDFTLVGEESNDQLKTWFEEAFESIREEANIPLEITDQNDHEDGGMNFYISYVGPLGGGGAHKNVKVDISRNEELVFTPEERPAIINYTDLEEYSLLCYPLCEVLVEKLRSTMQRMQPRDYYDIWYLLETHQMDVDHYVHEFREKCESKGIDASSFHQSIEKRIPQYKGRWARSMADQIKDLPPFEQVQRELNRHFKRFDV